jgi:hypothetical protein
MNKKSVVDRILTAILIATLAGITLLLLPLAFSRTGSGKSLLLYSWLFSWTGAFVLLGFAMLGYLLSDEKIEGIFSLLWGTHAIYKNRWFQFLVIAVITILVVKFDF